MTATISIRNETPSDHNTISEIIRDAFAGMPYAEGDEHELVQVLRREGALSVSLVAECENKLVGHIAFSPAKAQASDGLWFALGPLVVIPEYQRTGIGSQLVLAGLEALGSVQAAGCILVGHPDFYQRFGFVPAPALAPPGQPAEYFFIKRLGGQMPQFPVYFHEAFGSPG